MGSTKPASYRRPLTDVRVAAAMHLGILTCSPDVSVRQAARMMATQRVHCVVIRDARNGTDCPHWGVLSDLDLAAALTDPDFLELTVAECAATEPLTVSAQDTLERAAQLMAEHHTAHLIVESPFGRQPVGVLSTLDLARVAASVPGRAAA